jgi:hypothetical protein
MLSMRCVTNNIGIGSALNLRAIATLIFCILAACSLAAAQSDTMPPQLVGLSISPSSVDVTASAQIVTFTLQIKDNLSGIDSTSANRVAVFLTAPSGTQTVYGLAQPQQGVILEGSFQVFVSIPRYSEAGTWQIGSVRLRDNVGNISYLSNGSLTAAGSPTTVQVQDATPDNQPPVLKAALFEPPIIDVSNGPQTVRALLSIDDPISGVNLDPTITSYFSFILESPAGQQIRLFNFHFRMVSGDVKSGVWEVSFVMPQYSDAATWRISYLVLTDFAGNSKYYYASSIPLLGFDPTLEVLSSLSDRTAPSLAAFSIEPTVIDTSIGPQDVKLTLRITDDLAGVSFTSDTYYNRIWFRSPSGAQYAGAFRTGFQRIQGNELDGVYEAIVTIPRFSEAGTWKPNLFRIEDRTHNVRNLSADQLATAGLPNAIIVIKPSLVPDGIFSVAGGTVSDSTFGSRAQLTVPPGVLTQDTAIAIDVFNSPLQVPLPAGFSGSETFFVNIELNPPPSYPLPAPGMTLVLPIRNYVIPGTAISLLRIDPLTGILVPLQDASGNPISGQVDPGGLTATFHGIVHFCTVVGLLPTATTLQVAVQQSAINTKSHGSIPVVIYSSPTLDATQIDPSTLRFSGASVETHPADRWMISFADLDDDGRPDLIAHFRTEELLLKPADTQGVIEGQTFDHRLIRGTTPVRIFK